MDVRLTPDQQALRDAAAQLAGRLGPRTVRELDDETRAAELGAALSASGWRELRVADDDGTPLASGVEAAIVAEQLGRGLADAPFIGPTLAAELRRLALAPPAGVDETVMLAPRLAALASGPEGAVAIDARGAGSALLVLPTGDGYALAAAELPVDQVDVRTDLTRPTAVPSGTVTRLPGPLRTLTGDDLATWTALGLALACADLVGTMQGAVQLACDYAVARRQYGAAIGSFQAVQHLLADAFVSMEGSRSVALHAAWAVDALPADDALAAASVAKAYCARAGRTVCETAIQVHGGIGNTWECLAHVFLRRAMLSSDTLGGTGDSLARVLHHHRIGR